MQSQSAFPLISGNSSYSRRATDLCTGGISRRDLSLALCGSGGRFLPPYNRLYRAPCPLAPRPRFRYLAPCRVILPGSSNGVGSMPDLAFLADLAPLARHAIAFPFAVAGCVAFAAFGSRFI